MTAVGLAAAGSHLDESAACVGGEGFFEVVDGFDLRRPEVRRRHLIRGQKVGEAGVEVGVRFEVLEEGFRPMKGEDVAALR